MLMLAQKRAEAHNKNSCLKLHAFDLKSGGNIQLIKIYNYYTVTFYTHVGIGVKSVQKARNPILSYQYPEGQKCSC
jgi:hypothetical protein